MQTMTGAQLREWRTERGLATRELSRRIGYHEDWCGHVEGTGSRPLTRRALLRIIALGMEIEQDGGQGSGQTISVPRPCSQCGVSLLTVPIVYPAERDGKVARCCSRECRDKWLRYHKPRKRSNHLPSDSIWRRASCG